MGEGGDDSSEIIVVDSRGTVADFDGDGAAEVFVTYGDSRVVRLSAE